MSETKVSLKETLDQEWLYLIKEAQQLGLSLDEIQYFIQTGVVLHKEE
ncbi:anti-repressor SinI family protein [Metabacillus herbersteinensis]|uniref:Anti-repressor SinI family protein n=1 Tax=Metabacillus herbersteinensis TaxID=283816 RepID=A0ABV6G8H8_9BACI